MATAQMLAWTVEQNVDKRDVLTQPVFYDVELGVSRPLTKHELEIAKRYIRRCERQRDYLVRRNLAAERRREALARAERAAHDEDKLRAARAGMARVAAASR
jgi:hypothetical protein